MINSSLADFEKVFSFTKALDLYSPIWSNWVGLSCILVIAASCIFNIYSRWVDDTLADRIYYWAMLITSACAMLGYFGEASNPKLIFQTYMALIAVRFVSNILEHVVGSWFRLEDREGE